ncbi:MAG: amino acid ABC transporter substrate-binding protein [Oscillospiraceae bacterium]|jgi:ABC-type amino acid transport substrate-binding protein|nr:amino acid ABC transporter substrate-binding protein [Oscillospiraceae bacterium]
MKKILTALLALMALVMALSLSACGGGSGDLTVEKGKLHMSTNAEFPPYEMVKGDGGFEGIDVEVAGLIAEKLGLELVVDDMGFTAALEAVQNGRSDIAMAGITVNEDRLANMDFTDSYATGVQVVIIKADSPAVQSIDDLASAALIGTQEGTTGYIYCSYPPEEGGYGEDHVVAYETGAVAVQALLAGQVDCVVIDNQPAQEYVKANPGLEILDTEFAVEDYAIAVKKGNTQLLEQVNKALGELIADGSVQKVVDKYITAG